MIFLIGMMGSGKSTVGRELAKALDYSFIDTDSVIEDRYMKIHKLIKREGIDVFRDIENQVLKDIVATSLSQKIIIATGGGIILRRENREVIEKSSKKIIYLKNSIDSLIRHLQSDNLSKRPLLNTDLNNTLTHLLSERSELYEGLATFTITCDHLNKKALVEQIKQSLLA
ncbi:shikimate kinase [Haloplasma contractile]|uniref:Shikimate kinase n=1 Tax=Haloplasma contractile SSD-17B TaxID=1033810 RepID=U2EFT1_9MOLU|nr:shikimate kinase [Haloplasma contractile]ERJ13783.1 Shikimate kinase protein [Haloplasma contractile SSD-17B]